MSVETEDVAQKVWRKAYQALSPEVAQVVVDVLCPASPPSDHAPQDALSRLARWETQNQSDFREAKIRSAWTRLFGTGAAKKRLIGVDQEQPAMCLLLMLHIHASAQNIQHKQLASGVPAQHMSQVDDYQLPIATVAHALYKQGIRLTRDGGTWRVQNLLAVSHMQEEQAHAPETEEDANLQRIKSELQALLRRSGDLNGLDDLRASVRVYEEDHAARPFIVANSPLSEAKKTHIQQQWEIPVMDADGQDNQEVVHLFELLSRAFDVLALSPSPEPTPPQQTASVTQAYQDTDTVINAETVYINQKP